MPNEWKKGDLVKVDEPLMSATWHASLYRQKTDICWVTLGVWKPWKNEDGSWVSDFWSDVGFDENEEPTTRQLHSTDFVRDEA